MSDFINTIDLLGDDVVTESILNKSITEFHDNIVTKIREYAFHGCTQLLSVKLPNATHLSMNSFEKCTSLQYVDLMTANRIEGSCFLNCTNLNTLIVRTLGQNPDKAPCENSYAALNNTAIASGKGYIYVPTSTIESYKGSYVWQNYPNQFRALEDYTVDGTITGELDWNKINAEA